MKTKLLLIIMLAFAMLMPATVHAEKKRWKGVKVENFNDYNTEKSITVEWDNNKAVFYNALGGVYFCPEKNAVYVAEKCPEYTISTTEDFPSSATLTIIFGGSVTMSNSAREYSVIRILSGSLYMTHAKNKEGAKVRLKEEEGGKKNCIFVKKGNCTIKGLNIVCNNKVAYNALEIMGTLKVVSTDLMTDLNGTVFAKNGFTLENASLGDDIIYDAKSGYLMKNGKKCTYVWIAAHITSIQGPLMFTSIPGTIKYIKDPNNSDYGYRMVLGNKVQGGVYWNPTKRTLILKNVQTDLTMVPTKEFKSGDIIQVIGKNSIGGIELGDGGKIDGLLEGRGRSGGIDGSLTLTKAGLKCGRDIRLEDLTLNATGFATGIQGSGTLTMDNVKIAAKATSPSGRAIFDFDELHFISCDYESNDAEHPVVYNLNERYFTTLPSPSTFNLKGRTPVKELSIKRVPKKNTNYVNTDRNGRPVNVTVKYTISKDNKTLTDVNGIPFYMKNSKQSITLPFQVLGKTEFNSSKSANLSYTTDYGTTDNVNGFQLDISQQDGLKSGKIYYVPDMKAIYLESVNVSSSKPLVETNSERAVIIVSGDNKVSISNKSFAIKTLGGLEILAKNDKSQLTLNGSETGIFYSKGLTINANMTISVDKFCLVSNDKSGLTSKQKLNLKATQEGGSVITGPKSISPGKVNKSLADGQNDLIYKRKGTNPHFCDQNGKPVRSIQFSPMTSKDANLFNISISTGDSDWSLKEAIEKKKNMPTIAQ